MVMQRTVNPSLEITLLVRVQPTEQSTQLLTINHNTVLKESKKIPKGNDIPDGWSKGRVINFDKKAVKSEFQIKRENDIKLYSEYLEIYENHGFEKFVELTGYKFSKANLVQRFKKLLPNFKPQNGRKR